MFPNSRLTSQNLATAFLHRCLLCSFPGSNWFSFNTVPLLSSLYIFVLLISCHGLKVFCTSLCSDMWRLKRWEKDDSVFAVTFILARYVYFVAFTFSCKQEVYRPEDYSTYLWKMISPHFCFDLIHLSCEAFSLLLCSQHSFRWWSTGRGLYSSTRSLREQIMEERNFTW